MTVTHLKLPPFLIQKLPIFKSSNNGFRFSPKSIAINPHPSLPAFNHALAQFSIQSSFFHLYAFQFNSGAVLFSFRNGEERRRRGEKRGSAGGGGSRRRRRLWESVGDSSSSAAAASPRVSCVWTAECSYHKLERSHQFDLVQPRFVFFFVEFSVWLQCLI